MALLVRDFDFLISTNLSRDVLAGVVRCDDLDLVAVGWSQGPLALGLTVHIQRSLTYTVTVAEDPLEASWLVVSVDSLLTDLLLDRLAHLPLPLHGGLLAHHLVLVVALLDECRLTGEFNPVRYQINQRLAGLRLE